MVVNVKQSKFSQDLSLSNSYHSQLGCIKLSYIYASCVLRANFHRDIFLQTNWVDYLHKLISIYNAYNIFYLSWHVAKFWSLTFEDIC